MTWVLTRPNALYFRYAEILNEKETRKLIEYKKSGFYKISNHPDFVIYKKKDLIKDYSNNKYITQIVNQLHEI